MFKAQMRLDTKNNFSDGELNVAVRERAWDHSASPRSNRSFSVRNINSDPDDSASTL
jgi:hypothetical protein